MCCLWCLWFPGCSLVGAGTLVTFSLFSSFGRFLFLAACCLGRRIMVAFAFPCFAHLAWTGCFAFVFFSDLFCFIFLIPGRALSHVHSRTLARVHTLPLARGHACSCMPVWVSSWPGPILVPTFLSPPPCLCGPAPSTPGVDAGLWGGGWVPSPSGVWGAAPGAFVLVCVVRMGWAGPSVSCALFSSPWFGK